MFLILSERIFLSLFLKPTRVCGRIWSSFCAKGKQRNYSQSSYQTKKISHEANGRHVKASEISAPVVTSFNLNLKLFIVSFGSFDNTM